MSSSTSSSSPIMDDNDANTHLISKDTDIHNDDQPSKSPSSPTLFDRIQQVAASRGLHSAPPPPSRSKSLNEFIPINLCWSSVSVEVRVKKPKLANAAASTAPPSVSPSPSPSSPSSSSLDDGEKFTTKLILNEVSGYCKPGTLMAIMGASGAGKTTLLNVLSGRSQSYTGSMYLNHRPFTYSTLKYSAFVQQSDLFYNQLTVKEHLMFQARLRLPSSVTWTEKEERVEAVIQELGLSKVKNNRIGMVGMGGISGGERRRLSVGTEILTNPSLLFLDEPSTGLDSFMAVEVINLLKRLAGSGRTVICTIHQPSSEIYSMFDSIMYMAEGRVCFFGTLPYAITYFSRMDFTCPSWSNPSDYFIKLLSIVPSKMAESKKQVAMINERWERSVENTNVIQDIHQINNECDEKGLGKLIEKNSFLGNGEYNATWVEQMRAMSWRVWVTSRRDPMFFSSRLVQCLALGIIVGLIYLSAGDGQRSVQNKTGALYFLLMNQAMNSVFNVQHSFPPEVSIVKREYASGTYRSDVYFLAKTLVVTPMQMLFLIILTSIAYWMIGLSSSAAVWIELVLLYFLCMQSALSLGYFISCAAPSQNVALAMAPILLLPIVTFGGLTINSNSIPNYFYWLSYLSFMKYGYETAVVTVYKTIGSLDCDGSTGSICRYPDGQSVLDYFGFSDSNTGRNIGALIGLTIGFRLLAYYFFWKKLQYNPYQTGMSKGKGKRGLKEETRGEGKEKEEGEERRMIKGGEQDDKVTMEEGKREENTQVDNNSQKKEEENRNQNSSSSTSS